MLFDPASVADVTLDKLVRLNGISRIKNQPTRVPITVSGTAGTLVPAGSVVETLDKVSFITEEDVLIPGQVMTTCTRSGAIQIKVDEVQVIVTPIVGWTSVTNNEPGVIGIIRETDTQLRARRERSVIRTGTSTAEAIYSGVADLNLEFIAIIEK